jgi:hypothetical protein
MTKEEAILILQMNAMRNHRVDHVTAGVSHGDPGGYPIITWACNAVSHDGYKILSVDESQCDCGAKQHNDKMGECWDVLLGD